MARVVYDLDQTLVGFDPKGRMILNAHMVGAIERLRMKGHTPILWTFGNRNWWRAVRRTFPVLAGLFAEIYTRDERRGHLTKTPGGPHYVKDIRMVNGDILIDNDPIHREWARRHRIPGQYVIAPAFGVPFVA